MALHITNDASAGGRLGESLGTGLGQGLESLAKYKLDNLLGKKKETELSGLLKGANYDEPTSNLLAKLQQLDPQNFHKILSLASGAQGGQSSFNESSAQAKQQQWLQSPQANKAIEIANGYDDIIQTGERMLERLNQGVDTGIIAGLKGKYAPSWLTNNSESFLKDAAHILNLSTEGLKGAPSRLRIAWQEAEKPGLNHSPNVNRQIIQQKVGQAKAKRDQFYKLYPQLREYQLENGPQETLQQQLQQQNQQRQIKYSEDGTPMKWDPATNKWRKAKKV